MKAKVSDGIKKLLKLINTSQTDIMIPRTH